MAPDTKGSTAANPPSLLSKGPEGWDSGMLGEHSGIPP
ncbi:hypothetical protein IWX64_000027 [Arthrobacter sp. CAN_A212]